MSERSLFPEILCGSDASLESNCLSGRRSYLYRRLLTHGVSGVDWRFYKHPLPASAYDVYMKYRADVSFTT